MADALARWPNNRTTSRSGAGTSQVSNGRKIALQGARAGLPPPAGQASQAHKESAAP
jgi:hypothetical protein